MRRVRRKRKEKIKGRGLGGSFEGRKEQEEEAGKDKEGGKGMKRIKRKEGEELGIILKPKILEGFNYHLLSQGRQWL